MTRAVPIAAVLASGILAARPAAAACAVNAVKAARHLTVAASGGTGRAARWRAPGGALGMADADRAVFAAFASGTRAGGCPQLWGPDARDRPIAFGPANKCLLASHGE